jgi:hypothetical protein
MQLYRDYLRLQNDKRDFYLAYLLIIFPDVVIINTQSKDENRGKCQVIEHFISRQLKKRAN